MIFFRENDIKFFRTKIADRDGDLIEYEAWFYSGEVIRGMCDAEELEFVFKDIEEITHHPVSRFCGSRFL